MSMLASPSQVRHGWAPCDLQERIVFPLHAVGATGGMLLVNRLGHRWCGPRNFYLAPLSSRVWGRKTLSWAIG